MDKYLGPYEIKKIIGPSTLFIDEDGKYQKVHMSRVKNIF